MFKKILWFTLGAVVGASLAYVYCDREFKKAIEEHFDNIKDAVQNPPLRTRDSGDNVVHYESYTRKNERCIKEKLMNRALTRNYETPIMDTLEEAFNNELAPHVITFESFAEEEPSYDKITITYYEEDNTLVDETDDPIDDVERLIGDDALSRFGENSEDPDIVYVRNDSLKIDFEIVKDPGCFGDIKGSNEE